MVCPPPSLTVHWCMSWWCDSDGPFTWPKRGSNQLFWRTTRDETRRARSLLFGRSPFRTQHDLSLSQFPLPFSFIPDSLQHQYQRIKNGQSQSYDNQHVWPYGDDLFEWYHRCATDRSSTSLLRLVSLSRCSEMRISAWLLSMMRSTPNTCNYMRSCSRGYLGLNPWSSM